MTHDDKYTVLSTQENNKGQRHRREKKKKHGNIHTKFKTLKAGIDMKNKEKRKNRKHKNVMAE